MCLLTEQLDKYIEKDMNELQPERLLGPSGPWARIQEQSLLREGLMKDCRVRCEIHFRLFFVCLFVCSLFVFITTQNTKLERELW